MRSIQQQARFAGMLYLLMALTAPIGLLVVPAKLIVRGDAAATADHLRAGAMWLRIGIASELVHQVVFLFLGLALYRLLRGVSKSAAVQMVMLVAMSVPIMFVNAVNELAALILTSAPPFLAAFTRPQLDSLAYFFLRLHSEGIGVVEVFWALWLVPFAVLVLRSRFLPRVLGILLLAAALGDFIIAVTSLFPGAYTKVLDPVGGILSAGELPLVLWLVIWGVKREPERVTASPV